ncbi:MAG: PLDc N-terminal domain-containing protein [Solirubrobacteraceae bacterium]
MLPVLIAIPLLIIWIACVVDVVRRKDLTTAHKWLWALFVLLVPVIGVIAYLVTRPPQPSDWSQPGEQGDQTFEPIRRRHGPA